MTHVDLREQGFATASDEQLALAVADADVPSLLATLALVTGDTSLLRDDITPDRNPIVENAGLDEEQLALGRRIALQELKALRDRGQVGHQDVGTVDPTVLAAVLGYLADGTSDLMPLLLDELSLDGDANAPSWTLDEVAPGVDFPVVIIGAGMSGLLMGHRLKQAGIPFSIIEKNPDVGGTWFENIYPGCRVDNPSHTYSFSFWDRTTWPNFYSPQPVLLDYWRDFAERTGVREHIRFGHEVTSVAFDESSGEWTVTTVDADGTHEELVGRAVVAATGQLNRPRYPALEGLDDFTGPAFHSARWDPSVDLTGKRVAVIGTGASAVQIVPNIAGQVKQLSVFQRSAPWLAPMPTYTQEFPATMSWLLQVIPNYAKIYRFWRFSQNIDGILPFTRFDPEWQSEENSGSELNEQLRQALTESLVAQADGDADLLAKVIPQYRPVTKRMLIDDGSWMTALKRDNVELVTDPIVRVTDHGIETEEGGEQEFDVLIYATGFTPSEFQASISITGRDGRDLHNYWAGDARAHLGLTVPGFPNLFMLYGPNTNIVVNGSIIFFSECGSHFVMESIHHMLEHGHRTMECTQEALDAFVEESDQANARHVWGAPDAVSWYKNAVGRVSQNWGLSLIDYWHRTRAPEPGQYHFE